MCYRTGKHSCASFSLEILKALAVKGLMQRDNSADTHMVSVSSFVYMLANFLVEAHII